MAAAPVILIFGAGPRVGQSVAQTFISKGYKAALVSRSQKDENTPDRFHLSADLSDPTSVADIFSKVTKELGPPSVVVYNAAAWTSTGQDPLSLKLDAFTRDLHINTTSAYAAAQQAALSFQSLPSSASKTFIYTGNLLNTAAVVPFFNLGVGKSATAHIIQVASEAYKDKGFKFYYADERNEDGSPPGNGISGEAHAKFYAELADGKTQGPWQQTFVKDKGYVKF